MEIDFDKLIRLQQIDSEIRQISHYLEIIPHNLEETDKKIEASFQLVQRAKEKLALNQKKRRELEAKVKDVKTLISKYKLQLNEVKTNKEYAALLREIEQSQKAIDELEEEIIGEMLSADDIEKEIQETSQKHDREKEKYRQEKEGIQQRKREFEGRIQQLKQERESLLPSIPQEQFSLYLRIYHKKNGVALSPVKDDFCSLCHMRIRPQVLNELRDSSKLIFCENCGRILYWSKEETLAARRTSGPSRR